MQPNRSSFRKITLWVLVIAIFSFAAFRFFSNHSSSSSNEFPLFTVEKSHLDINVTSTGTIQSRHSEVVRSQARGRLTATWVIDEGRVVTNGQLLVSLDSSDIEKDCASQEITVANAEASLIQAKEQLAIAEIDKESKLSSAELSLHLARLSLEKYEQGEYPQQLQDAESRIAVAQEELERANETLGWTRKLAAEGFVTRSDLQADELSLRQRKISLDAAITSMNVLTNYTAREQHAKLNSDVSQAERALDRAQRETRSNIVQAQTTVTAREQEFERQKDRLQLLKDQIVACKITAPTNGLVIYASTMQASRRRWGGEPLAAGSQIHQNQDLMFIPIDGKMIAQFTIPESELSKIKKDIPATITVDALPDFSIGGTLSKIGLLPDGANAWLNPDMNVYNCEVSINMCSTTNSSLLRAGMSCNISMSVASYDDIIAVPMQCVLRVGNEPCVFLLNGETPIPRPVKIGYDNGRLVHITDGLAPGEKIMLTPPLASATKSNENQPTPAPQP